MAMQISKADTADFAGIRAIWEEQFTTDSGYLNIMFGEIMPKCTSYVSKTDNRIVSALSLMPMHFIDELTGIKLSGWYMFGVATLKGFWGKRIAAQMIEYTCSCEEKAGHSFIFERPATPDLNRYYYNLGFTKHLKYIPHVFESPVSNSSTGNNQLKKQAETDSTEVAKTILKDIKTHHPQRFEWENTQIVESLIKLGELDFHNTTYCKTPPQGVFISIRTLNNTSAETFNNSFFCFPME